MLPAPLIPRTRRRPRSPGRWYAIGAAVGYDLVVADPGTPIPPDTAAVVVALARAR